MKNISITFLYCISSFVAFSQATNHGSIKGYVNNEHLYFDSLNKLWNKDIACSATPQWVYVSFKVDTNAIVTDLCIMAMAEKLPEPMKVYVQKLVESTNGQWVMQVKDGKKVTSENMTYRFDFEKAGLTLDQRLQEGTDIFEYYVLKGFKNEFLTGIDDAKGTKFISLFY